MITEFDSLHRWRSDRRGPVRWIYSHIKRNWWLFLGIVLGAMGNAAGAALMPIYIGQAFNAISKTPPDTGTLLTMAILIAVSQLARGVLQLMRNFSAELIGQRLERDTRDELYTDLLSKSMTFHDRQSVGDVMARATSDVREINLLASPGLNIVLGSASFILFPLIFAPRIYPQLILAPALFVPLYIFLVRGFLSELAPRTEKVRREFGAMNSALEESVEGVETVKANAQEERETNKFKNLLLNWRNATVDQARTESRFLPLLLYGATQALGLAHSMWLWNAGQINLGDVIAYNGLLMLFQFPTFASQFAYVQVSSGIAGARRLLGLMGDASAPIPNPSQHEEGKRVIVGDVAFDHVTFGYESSLLAGGAAGEPASATLRDVSFHARAGQTVAIVGQTGSGKSSITKLINRIYDADEGSVKIDGIDVRNWDLANLRSQISIIEQDLFLFSRSIADNIGYGKPGATRDEIVQAARAAQAHDFITSFKDGYETIVGERGVTLSGGQRQRIAIARAFLTDPRILILDDSTSAIDSATEDMIQQAIQHVAEGRTTFLITHRLSQIRWSDLIIVMRKGRVAAIGSHEELMRTSASYREIFP